MKKLAAIFVRHWQAKILTLALALLVWALVRKNIEPTGSPSRFQLDSEREPATKKFDFKKP